MTKKLSIPVIVFMVLVSSRFCLAGEPVSLQLKWRHQYQFAGYYAAVEKGFYQEEGLDVTIREGSPQLNPVDEVMSGAAEFGIAASGLVIHKSEGKDVVALAVIFQKSPTVLLTKKSSGISTLLAVAGEEFMTSPNEVASAEIYAMFLKEGIGAADLKPVAHSWDIEDLVKDRIKVFGSYITDQPFYLAQKGIAYNIISPRDYGVDFYGDVLFSSARVLQRNPERVKRFRRASLKGWNYAVEHSDEIIDVILHKYGGLARGLTQERLRFEANATNELVFADIVNVGHMNPARWQQIVQTYIDLGIMQNEVSLDGFIYDPNPTPNVAKLYWIIGIILSASGAIGLIAFVLLRFNRRLQAEITEHQKTTAFLDEIYQNADSGLFIVDVIDEKKFVYAGLNPAYEKLLGGIPNDRIAGQTPQDLTCYFHEEIIEMVLDLFRQCVAERKTIIKEHSTIFHGKQIWCLSRVSPILDERNRVCKLIGTALSINEQKKAEEALRESEERLRLIVETIRDGIIFKNAAGEVLTWNRNAEEIFGVMADKIEKEEINRMNWPVIREDGSEYQVRDYPSEITLQTGKPCYNKIMGIHRPSGELRWLSVNTSPLFEEPEKKPTSVVISFSDITEKRNAEEALRKSEKELRLTLDATTDGIWTWDFKTDTLFFSDKYYTMLGYEPNEFPANRANWVNLVYPEDLETSLVGSTNQAVLATDNYENEIRLKTKQGGYRWIHTRARIVERDEEGKALFMIGNHEDITERKEAENRIKANLKEKETLLQEIHHRVKNNMQVVASLLKLQAEKVGDPRVKEALRESQNRVYAMATVHEILHESHDLAEIDLQAYLTKIVDALAQTYSLSQGRITLKTDVEKVFIGIYQASPLCLTINELISNSFKYAFPDNREGEIKVVLKRLQDSKIELTIADNGVGLPKDFDWRGSDTLGLHLVRLLIEQQLDGLLNMETGPGTKFTAIFNVS